MPRKRVGGEHLRTNPDSFARNCGYLASMLLSDHSHDGRPTLIAASQRGSASRCSCCGSVHLRFGNAVLNLDPADVAPLIASVRASRRKAHARPALASDVAAHHVELYIADTGVGFSFDAGELAELERLLSDVERRIASLGDPVLPEPIIRRIERRPDATA